MRNILLFCLYVIAVSSQDGNITCTVPPTELFQEAVLTCNYPEDLNVTKKDFSVNYNPHHIIPDSVLDCWWLRGQMACSAKPGIKYQTHVNTTFTITFTNVTSVTTGTYACQVANYDPNFFQTCQLKVKTELEGKVKTPDQSFKTLAIVLPVGLIVLVALVAAAIVLVLKYKRKILHPHRQRTEEPDSEEGQPMLQIKEPGQLTMAFQEYLVKEVFKMYPNLSGTPYFVPPVYFNRTRYRPQTVAGQLVYVPDLPNPIDVTHDRAMQHVIHCLRHMAESQEKGMFVLTQFQYEDYLNSPDPAYRHHCLPIPAGLREADSDVGCFDFLIVHRLHGLLVGVVKAVSAREVESQYNELNIGHVIVQEVTEAVQQLEKAKRMIQHLMSDQQNVPNVQQTLIFPNLYRLSLRDAVRKNDNLVEKLRACLRANAIDDPTELCLCAEQLSDSNTPWDVSHTVVSIMLSCWKWDITRAEYATMTDELYLNIIARFFGPATQSSLRVPEDYERFSLPKTLPEAVSLTGDLFARLVLSPDLIELLDEPRVVLSGPPNSGKTTLLSLAGAKWLSSGHDVFVIKKKYSKNVSILLQHLKSLKSKHDTEESSEVTFGSVYQYECSFNSRISIKKCIENMVKRKTKNFPCVLIDETILERQRLAEFVDILLNQILDSRCWAVCRNSPKRPETCRRERCLTEVLVSPPVLRELEKVQVDSPRHADADTYPLPTDGLPVKHFYHKLSGIRWSHSPQECLECGHEVGSFLAKSLLITGKDKLAKKMHTDEVKMEETMKGMLANPLEGQSSRRGLQFRDILLVFEFFVFITLPDVKDDCNFLKGLRESGIMVHTVTDRDIDDLGDEDSDVALAVHVRHMKTWMTKRKIVVYVESELFADFADRRRRALLSCTSQLIWVHPQKANTHRSSLLSLHS